MWTMEGKYDHQPNFFLLFLSQLGIIYLWGLNISTDLGRLHHRILAWKVEGFLSKTSSEIYLELLLPFQIQFFWRSFILKNGNQNGLWHQSPLFPWALANHWNFYLSFFSNSSKLLRIILGKLIRFLMAIMNAPNNRMDQRR